MKQMDKKPILLAAITIAVLGLMMIESIHAELVTPSAPEFSLKTISYQAGVAPTNLEITIKNQPFTPYIDTSGSYISLYYNVRFKGHYSDEWRYYPENHSSSYTTASSSEYTTISFGLGCSPLGTVPAGGQVDFQVQALIGNDNKVSSNNYEFVGQKSAWSNTQTVVMPETSTSVTPTPTTPSLTPTQVSISVDTSSATVGTSINIKGKLIDTNGTPLTNKIVTLSYTLAGISDRVPIGSGTTNTAGEYNLQWVNTASGTFTLTVDWIGDTVYQPSSNTTTLNFLPYQNQNVFLVESNSTVTALAYNSTNSELSFSVTGTPETTGYVKVTLAKSLTSNPENIKVYLDGNQLNYLVTSNADLWQLTFNYHHSTHHVTITLSSASSASFAPSQLELVIIGVAIITISIVIIVIALRKRKK